MIVKPNSDNKFRVSLTFFEQYSVVSEISNESSIYATENRLNGGWHDQVSLIS